MTLVAHLVIDGEPISKARARFTRYGSKVRTYTPERTLEGERRIAWAFRQQVRTNPDDAELAYRVEARFYNGTRQRRDIDNMVKLVLDGLNKVAWLDDNQVIEISARKSYVATKAEARTEVYVYEIGRLEPPKQPCVRCGTEFRTYDSWKSNPKGRKYCTRECAYAHRVERKARTCVQCGKTFQAWGESKETKYCSRECKSANGRATVTCSYCAVEFTKQKCHVREVNLCSETCQKAWNAKLARERRSKRFPGSCQVCGAGTTRKEYVRCNECRLAGAKPSGAPTIEELSAEEQSA